MRICILSNFGPGNGIGMGGCEMVISEVSKYLMKNLEYEITIFAFNYDKKDVYEGINIMPCSRGESLISKLNDFDHILIYSDSFWEMENVIKSIKKINCKVSVALVGAYFLQSHPNSMNLLKENIERFNIITHSTITPDYKWAVDNGLKVNVISNGVNISEFNNNNINFREKYNIKEKYVFLCVSNFLYGKNQSVTSTIYKWLHKKYPDLAKDSAVAFIFNSIKYKYADRFLYNCKKVMEPYNTYFLQDLPREDVVSAFKCSDVFLFASAKEVSPLVVLESQAAGLPWISMDVGDVHERDGGIVISSSNVDMNGYKCFDSAMVSRYVKSLSEILTDIEMKNKLSKDGIDDVQKYDWSKIYQLYDKVFNL